MRAARPPLRARARATLAITGLALVALAWRGASAEPETARAAGIAGEAKKGPRSSSLSWVRLPGAEGCVATQALARAVEDRLGRSVFVSAAQADVSVEGRVEPVRSGGYRAVLTLRDASGALLGTREIARAEPSCEAMSEPLALVIAVMIDPDAALGPKPASEAVDAGAPQDAAPPVDDAAPPPPPPPPAPPPAPRPPPTTPWTFEGSAAIVGSVGMLPRPGIGVGGNALLTPPKFPTLEGFGAIFFDNTASAENGAYTTFNLGYVGSGLCPFALLGQVARFFGCVESHLGVVRNRQTGFVSGPSDDFRVLVDSALEARVTLRLFGPFAFRAGVAGAVPWLRYEYRYARADGSSARTFRMAPVVGIADVGLGLVVP